MATERRLIDANAISGKLKNKMINQQTTFINTVLLGLIETAPTVDAVEVIRCKDCKHYVLHALACRHENFNGIINMDGFCSYGERRTDNE